MPSKKQIYLILISLCFLAYANSLGGAFVSDDIPSILKNPQISESLRYWLTPHVLLNSVAYNIAGFNPFIYHLTNIILHSIVTVMVFFFLNLFFKAEASFLAACLFAVHPVHSEAVAWISGRLYIEMALFILATYFLYNRATDFAKKGKGLNLKPYLFCLIIFSYYMIVNFTFYFLFPFFLILSDVVFKRYRITWKYWLPFLGIVALRVIMARAMISTRVLTLAKEMGGNVTWSNPLFNMVYSFFSNLGLLVWPQKLTLYHEPPVITSRMLTFEMILLAVIVLALPFVYRKAKELFFALGIFILFLAPTYSPIMVSWLVAERYLYFPSVALCMFAGFFYERYAEKSEQLKKNLLILFILIIAAYGARTVARNEDWKTPERLWRQTTLASPYSPRSHNNMGDAYYQEGNMEGAIREFKKAVELKPDYADGYHNLANTYHKSGNLNEAAKFYNLALSYNPQLFESHFDLGILYLNTGKLDLAIAHLKKAADLRPENTEAINTLNFALQKKK